MYEITYLKPFGVLVKPTVSGLDITDLDLELLKSLFLEHQLIVIRGFQAFSNNQEFEEYCDAWGEVSLWPFGKVLELVEQENPTDHIFDNSYIPLHWDGMYRKEIPEYQIFYCKNAPVNNNEGRTTFSNTKLVLENIDDSLREELSELSGTYERKMEFYNSRVCSPVIVSHPLRGYPIIRYNEPPHKNVDFINPPNLKFSGYETSKISQLHENLEKILHSRSNFYAHDWVKGDVVIADNFSLLHGRERFTPSSKRHIQRVHVLSNPPVENTGLESYQ